MSLWGKLAVIFTSSASSAVIAWFRRILPILLTPSNLASGVFYFGAGCVFTLISLVVAVVLLFFSLTAKHTPAPLPAFPASPDGKPKRLTKVQKKKLTLVQQQQQQLWFAASKPQPAVYVAGHLQGTLWTIPVSAWPRSKLPPEHPPVSEGPAAISHKWDAVLSNGVLSLSLVGTESATRVEIPLPGCSCVVVKECLLKPDGKMMGPWHKRAPLELSHPSRPLLYGGSSVFMYMETGAAKEQWFLALTSESQPEGAQARARASYQAFCSHMVQAAERLALPQPPTAPPAPKPQQPALPRAGSVGDNLQKGGGKPGRKFGLGWVARLVPGRRGKPAGGQQRPSASPSQQDLQQQQQQQQQQTQTQQQAVADPGSQAWKDGTEGEPSASGGPGTQAPTAPQAAASEGGQAPHDPRDQNLNAPSDRAGPPAPAPVSFDFHCPSRLREDSLGSFTLGPSFTSSGLNSICGDRDPRVMQAVAEEEAGAGPVGVAGDPSEEPSLRRQGTGSWVDAGLEKREAQASASAPGMGDVLQRTVVASGPGVLTASCAPPWLGEGPASAQLTSAIDSALGGADGDGSLGGVGAKSGQGGAGGSPGAGGQGGESQALQLPIMPLTMDWPAPVSELPLPLLEPEAQPLQPLQPQEREREGGGAAAGQERERGSARVSCSSGGLAASSSVPDLKQYGGPLGSSLAGSYEDLHSLAQCRSPASSVSGRSDTAGHDPLKQESKQAAKEEQRRRDEQRRQQEDARRQQQQAAKRAAKEAAERQKQQQRDEASRQKSVKQEEARRKQEEQARARKEQEGELGRQSLPQAAADGKAPNPPPAPEPPGAGPRLPAGLDGSQGNAGKEEGADHRAQTGEAPSTPGLGGGDPSRGQVVAGLLGLNMLLTRLGFEILGAQRLERWLHRLVQRKLDEFKRPAYLHPLQLVTLDFGSSFPLLRDLRAVAGAAGGSSCTFPQLLADLAFSGRITLVVSTSVELQQAGLIKKLQAAFGRMAGIQGDQQQPAPAVEPQPQQPGGGGGSVRGSTEKLSELPASASGTFQSDDVQPADSGGGGGEMLRSRSVGLGAGASSRGLASTASSSSSLRLDDEKRSSRGEDADAGGRPRPAGEPTLTRRASDAPPAAGSSTPGGGGGGNGGGGNLFSGLLNLSRAAAAKAGSLAAGFTESLPRVPCQLEICITRFECELMVWASPPPSDRLWLCFAAPPSVDISTRPLFGNRILRYSAVLSQVSALLKAKILKALNKSLVYPAAVDIRLGFFANPGVTNEPKAGPAPPPQSPEAPQPQAAGAPNTEPADPPPAAAATTAQGPAPEAADPPPSDLTPAAAPPPPQPVLPPPPGLSLNIGLPPRPLRPQTPLNPSTSAPEPESSRTSAPGTPRSAASKAGAAAGPLPGPAAPPAPPAPSNTRKGLSLAFRFRGFGRKRENDPKQQQQQQQGGTAPAGSSAAASGQGHSTQASSRANSTQPNSRANSTGANSRANSLDLNPAAFPGIDEMTSVSPEGSSDESTHV